MTPSLCQPTSTNFLVLGVGGLGCPTVLGLLAQHAQHITLVDHDRVESHNLQRQVLYTTADLGVRKLDAATLAIQAVAPNISLTTIHRHLNVSLLEDLIKDLPPSTIVLECSDDPQLKFAVNDLCVKKSMSAVIAGVQGWHGQIFALGPSSTTACFRCIFEEPPHTHHVQTCAQTGIMGSVAGFFGYWMAHVALLLAQHTNSCVGTLIAVDLLQWHIQHIRPAPRIDCIACSHTNRVYSRPPPPFTKGI